MEGHKIKILLKQKELLLQKISNLEEIRANQENEIEEQEAVIKTLKQRLNEADERIVKTTKALTDNEKVIELMAKEINDNMFFNSPEEVIEYYEKKARDEK